MNAELTPDNMSRDAQGKGGKSVFADEISGISPNWLRHIRPRLVGLARRLLGNADDAEEVAQEALMLAWRRRGQMWETSARSAWLYRTTINICRNRLRKKKPSGFNVEQLVVQDTQATSVEQKELIQRIRIGMFELPLRLQVALVLHDLEGLNYEQVAAVLEIRPGTARVRVHRAREQLRKLLIRKWSDSFGKPL